MIYLDYAATTPLHPQILTSYHEVLSRYYGNADSNHPLGNEVQRLLQQARSQIADMLHVNLKEIVFTSGASEANNMAVKGYAFANQSRGKHLVTTQIEHSSVLESFVQLEKYFGFQVTYLPPDATGCVTLQQVQQAVREDTILVSMMYVNNETGAIQPIQEVQEWLKKKTHACFHVDMVQAAGKLLLPLKMPDMATLSAHKIHGLKGSGLLIKRNHVQLLPIISGGDQEFGLRAGTNNAPVNILFAKTLRLALQSQPTNYDAVCILHERLIQSLHCMPDVTLHSHADASPFIINFSTPLPSEIMMNALAQKGYCVAAKSTCNTQAATPSHVLLAQGISKSKALNSIRVSLHSDVSSEQMTAFIQDITPLIEKYRT